MAESTNMKGKSLSSIEKIPEDVSSIIATFIKSWERERGGSLEKREIGRKLRDKTLRSLALTSSRGLQLWLPQLLQSVTLSRLDFPSFLSCLNDNVHPCAALIKSLRLHWGTVNQANLTRWQKEAGPFIVAHSSLNSPFVEATSEAELEPRLKSGLENLTQPLLHQLRTLKELIVEDSAFLFDFQSKIKGRLLPLPFLDFSLKKLYIGLFSDGPSISARNAVWLLTFCQKLNEACLGFNFTRDDIKYLEEYKSIFKGKSNVKKLAIMTMFISDKAAQSFNLPNFTFTEHISGFSSSKRRESLSNFLEVTKNLESFEINSIPSARFKLEDEQEPKGIHRVITGLSASFDTLKHLRLFDEQGVLFLIPISRFTALKILSYSFTGLSISRREMKSKVEVLQLAYYGSLFQSKEDWLQEELVMSVLIEMEYFPNLKEVVVPQDPINFDGKIREADTEKWVQNRTALKSSRVIENEMIKLRFIESGETDEQE